MTVKVPFFVLPSVPYTNDFPDNFICNIAGYVVDTAFCSKCHWTCGNRSRWLLNLNVLRNTVDYVDSYSGTID